MALRTELTSGHLLVIIVMTVIIIIYLLLSDTTKHGFDNWSKTRYIKEGLGLKPDLPIKVKRELRGWPQG